MGKGMGDGPFCPQGRADMGPGGPGMGHGRFGNDGPGIGHFLAMADELGLTDQQREQFKKMQVDFRMQMIDKDAAVDKAEAQLRSVMTDDNASESEVARLIDDVARLRADVQKTRFAHHKQMKSMLTAEQVKKIETLRKERREARQEAGQGMGAGQRRGHGKGNKS
jgi:Spy/CpxP family protein refolding chaperone